jgi:hypothetical protein
MTNERGTNPAGSSLATRNDLARRYCEWALVLIVTIVYLATLTPGHDFGNDDFAAYVMHAANLAEGRPFMDIHYVANPRALWLAPSNGYPPVYPALLAPVYKIWGFNLEALKVVTVFCFSAFLVIFAEILRPELPMAESLSALLIVGLNPAFWKQHDELLSEFPYLLFSFGALLVIRRVYRDLNPQEAKTKAALLLAILIYCAYGTRTIGIALLPALAIADFVKFKKVSRFAITVLVATSVLVVAQTIFLTYPTGYLSAEHISIAIIWRNAVFYAKSLSYFWQNGFSKGVQIAFALLFGALACIGFLRKLSSERGAEQIYLLLYLAILCAWNAEIGLRGLLPVFPIYLAFGLMEFTRIVTRMTPTKRVTLTVGLLFFVGVTYAGKARSLSRQPLEANVGDPSCREMAAYVKGHTEPSDVLIFPKPRGLALLTDRYTASLAPDEAPADSYEFMKSVKARFIVSPVWAPSAWSDFIAAYPACVTEVFQNSEYRMYEVKLNGDAPAAFTSGHEK